MPPAIAVVQGCCQTSAAQTGIRFRFRRQTQLQLAPFYEHRFPLFCGTSLPPGRERRACCGYLNQGHRLSPLPQGKTTTPNYPLKHARSGSDSLTALTSPMRNRPRRPGPLRSYLGAIFMRFRGPQALKDSLETIRRSIRSLRSFAQSAASPGRPHAEESRLFFQAAALRCHLVFLLY